MITLPAGRKCSEACQVCVVGVFQWTQRKTIATKGAHGYKGAQKLPYAHWRLQRLLSSSTTTDFNKVSKSLRNVFIYILAII